MKRLALTLSTLVLTTGVNAQNYVEIGYTSTDYSNSVVASGRSYDIKASPSAIRGILGHEFNPNFSLEGMLGQGLSDSSLSVSGISTPVNLKIDTMYGIYAKPKAQVSPDLEVFARVGYAHTSGTMSYQNSSSSSSGNSFSYGLGMSYSINKQMSVNFDAMSYYDKNSVSATGTTIGIGYKF